MTLQDNNASSRIGVYPGMTEEMLGFEVEKIETFFGVNF